ncbi:hypothetical protein KIMH_03940 [Bombiscardovia apis]|uniref:N-acetyltransferase domain-containing protein n=1 Tax=Bombiscardovia apis TaxID=2932182 RepID=A0ABM8BCB4_9BIFI|nr:GNAT family N-acetyltransferase [Bombiscardovia apis]BDR54283.1 hypothetical protein KIMH_03940 [Bombiscardovia apis]
MSEMQDQQTPTQQASQVTIRPMTWADVDQVVEEFNNTWSSKDSGEAQISLLNARHFVLRYLTETTNARVAELDGKFMGVALMRVQGQPLLFSQAQAELDMVDRRLSDSVLGRKNLRRITIWHGLEDGVEAQSKEADASQAELKLFVVSQAARGRGVGGKLWRDMLSQLDSKGVQRFFLHTDSACDVSYYDHIGMERVAARIAADQAESIQDGNFYDDIFIYAAPLSQQLQRWGMGANQQESASGESTESGGDKQ